MAAADLLLEVAASIADGTPLDWDDLRSRTDSDDREVLDALRAVSVLAGIHRSLPAEPDDLSATRVRSRPAGAIQSELGGFLLMERLGSGSQGEVYRAFDTRLERDVALKLRRLARPGANLAHILREGRLLAKVRHKHIVTVYGIEVVDDHVGISMELVLGETLDAVVRRDGPLAPERVINIGQDLCDAVDAVHAAGLIHRDIKAQNVVLETGGRVVLMDFGTGALEQDVVAAGHGGTPLYLAPELVLGGPASVRSDVYSIGVLLHFLLAGQFPYNGRSYDELRAQIEAGVRVPLHEVRSSLPDDLCAVVERCLSADPAARYPSARQLRDALNAVGQRLCGVDAGTTRVGNRLTTKRAALYLVPILALAALTAAVVSNSTPAAAPPHVLGVHPFTELSGNEALARVADGLTESLALELGRIQSLRVVGARAVRDAENSGRTIQLIQQAGITTFIGGTIDVSGSKARISIRATDAVTQARLWESRLERDRAELLTLQDEITNEIARRLHVELSAPHRELVRTRGAVTSEALDAYYRGWAELYRLTRSGHEEAERQFRKAVGLAPNFAPAHSALAYSVFMLGSSYRVLPPEQAYSEALAEAKRALALDPFWAHAHGVLGLLAFMMEWDWPRAETHFLAAIEANPSDAHVRGLYAQLLMLQNRLGSALAEARAAQRLDPLNVSRGNAVSVALYYARRYDEAIAEMEALQRLDPNSSVAHFGLARYYSAVGRFDEALRQLESAPYKDEPPPQAEYTRILAAAGRVEEAQARLPQLVDGYRQGRLAPDYLAYVYLALGDQTRALDLLDEAVRVRSPSVVWAQVDPRFDALRLDAKFRSLMNVLGFAQ